MQKLIWAILLLMVIAMGWTNYDTRQMLQESRQQLALASELNTQQQQQLELLHAEVVRLNQRVSTLDKNSVEGIVREANQAILQGWESLVSTVEEELKKAREKAAGGSSNQSPAPPQQQPSIPPGQFESPDGTDRT